MLVRRRSLEADPWVAPLPLLAIPQRPAKGVAADAAVVEADWRQVAHVELAELGEHGAKCGCKMCLHRARLYRWRDELIDVLCAPAEDEAAADAAEDDGVQMPRQMW